MRSAAKTVATLRASALAGLLVLAGCSGQPLSPDEERAMELETYCRGLAEDARSKHLAAQEQGQMDEIGENDQTWEKSAEGGHLGTKYEAVYSQCMKKNAPN